MNRIRSEEHTSELQSLRHLVCRLLLEKKKNKNIKIRLTRAYCTRHCLVWPCSWGWVAVVAKAVMTPGVSPCLLYFCVFFFNDTATTEIYTLSLHDALPI